MRGSLLIRSWSLLVLFVGLFYGATGSAQPPALPVIFSSAPLSPSSSTTPTLSGLSDNGTTIRIYVSGSCQGTPSAVIGPLSGSTFSVQVVVGANSTTTFTAQATNGTGNVSSCSTTFSYTHEFSEEICDGMDNDGDGLVDDGLPLFYADADLDGLGDPAQLVPCSTPGAVPNNADCNDNDPTPCSAVVIDALVERRVIGNAGGAAQIGGLHVEWTLGEALVSSIESNGLRLTQGFHQSPTYRLRLNLRALLQGPYVNPTVHMTDGLRSGGWIPYTEPYTAAGYVHVDGGNETTSPGVLAVVGPDAIVDWIVVELRDPTTPQVVISTRTGLLQRDGDIVDVDGFSPLAFKARAANYRVAVVHRNHLPVITAAPILLSTVPVDLDLTDGSTTLYGVEPTRMAGAVQLLWSGDVNADGAIVYTGSDNDRDPILFSIGGIIPTNTIIGYLPWDVDMDGTVKYTGTGNDRDPILQNIGGTVPTNIRNAQMP